MHNFPNNKYMLVSLKKKFMWKIRVNLTHNLSDPNPFLTHLKWPFFLPVNHLIRNSINPIRLFCHLYNIRATHANALKLPNKFRVTLTPIGGLSTCHFVDSWHNLLVATVVYTHPKKKIDKWATRTEPTSNRLRQCNFMKRETQSNRDRIEMTTTETNPRKLRGHKATATCCIASRNRPGFVATSAEVKHTHTLSLSLSNKKEKKLTFD